MATDLILPHARTDSPATHTSLRTLAVITHLRGAVTGPLHASIAAQSGRSPGRLFCLIAETSRFCPCRNALTSPLGHSDTNPSLVLFFFKSAGPPQDLPSSPPQPSSD